MTVTATGTFCSNDSSSTRAAISLAVVSKSMVVCFLSENEIGRSISALAHPDRGGLAVKPAAGLAPPATSPSG
jgi:hypothetical protein